MSLEWNIRCNWCKCVVDPQKHKFFYTVVFTEYDIKSNKEKPAKLIHICQNCYLYDHLIEKLFKI